jgi:hypothetical protein
MSAAPGRGRGDLRASRADREQVIELLKDAFVQDRLTKDELDLRVGQAFASRTYADLAAITADLPARPAAAQPRQPARAQERRRAVRPGLVLAVATVLYAGAWPLAIVLPTDGEGEPRAGASLIGVTTLVYVLVLVIAGVYKLNSRLEKRSRGQPPPGAA